MYLDGLFGRTAFIKEKEYLFFSGYDYLAVHTVPEFCDLVATGIQKYGWVYPSSRISNTVIDLYEQCEERLSHITQTEETVLFGSGFNAGQSAVSLFGNQLYNVNNSPLSHPAILWQKSELSKFSDWQKACLDWNSNSSQEQPVFASDAVNNFAVFKYDFDFFTQMKRYATLLVDDSHGIGITGATGAGVAEYTQRNPEMDYLFTYSMGKAFGVEAGAVSTNRGNAAKLRALPSFTAVTPPAPGPLFAFLHGQEIYANQLKKLRHNIRYMMDLLSNEPNVVMHPELPIVLLPSEMDDSAFFSQNIIISSFAYPDPKGKKLNRLVLNAAHTEDDLEKVAKAVIQMNKTLMVK